jgi:hypothetical protein
MVFATVREQLPAGFTIELRIGNLPIPWMLYARWGSLVVLATLVLWTFSASYRRRGGIAKSQGFVPPLGAELHRRTKTRRRAA